MKYGIVMTWKENDGTENSKLIAIGLRTKDEAQAVAKQKTAWFEKEFGELNNCTFRVVEGNAEL